MDRAGFIGWFQGPPVSGRLALVLGLFAVITPTAVRAMVSGSITGCEFTPYLPFVLLCAVLLSGWQAMVVAVASVAILGGLLGGSPAIAMDCFLPSAGIFLGSSAAMIVFAVLVRRAVASARGRGGDDVSDGLSFSLDKGEVWASWHGQGPPVRLGSRNKVAEIMSEFLAEQGRNEPEQADITANPVRDTI